MTWDLEKDVTYSDVGKAINTNPFGPPEPDEDRRLGICDWCGCAVEAWPVPVVHNDHEYAGFIVGIFIPLADWRRDAEFAHWDALEECICFHEWGRKVDWIAQTPPLKIPQTPIPGVFFGFLYETQQPRWLFGQCRSCGKAVERELPVGWYLRPPWEHRSSSDRPEASSSAEAQFLGDRRFVFMSREEIKAAWLHESQAVWLIEEGVTLDHDDEAIARYERLKAEKGSCECVDDDEPVDES
jgi:hypothetical protein